jgi:hypothetical protein
LIFCEYFQWIRISPHGWCASFSHSLLLSRSFSVQSSPSNNCLKAL